MLVSKASLRVPRAKPGPNKTSLVLYSLWSDWPLSGVGLSSDAVFSHLVAHTVLMLLASLKSPSLPDLLSILVSFKRRKSVVMLLYTLIFIIYIMNIHYLVYQDNR